MAQINITLNQEEILQLLCNDRDAAFRKLLQESLNSILRTESAEQLGAAPYERTDERTDSRNGVRERPLTTRIGRITLHVPRHRNVPFKTMVFENYSRSEAALITSMAEMVVNGVSTRKVAETAGAAIHDYDYDALRYGEGGLGGRSYLSSHSYILASNFTAATEFDVTEYKTVTIEGETFDAIVISTYR